MPRKRTASASVPPQQCFVKELAGETPPSFQAMERLYGLASDLYGLRPWRVLDEDNLIVVRDSVSGELCYCSVMGALGEVLSMHAYIGAEGLRRFRRIGTGEIAEQETEPGINRSLSVFQLANKHPSSLPDMSLVARPGILELRRVS